jgi:hypothetical protein
MLLAAFLSFLIMSIMLGIGVVGFHRLGKLPWIDALLNASMLLGGMGPVDKLDSSAGKIFASIYALVSGLVFIAAASVLLSPIFHRILHAFHIDDRDLQ